MRSPENLWVSPLRPTAWRSCATTFVLAVAIIGGLLAMHTLSADHGMDSPVNSMSHNGHPSDAGAVVAVAGDGDAVTHSSSASMTMLACILALLSITAFLAAAAPAGGRPFAAPASHTVVRSNSPGWSFSLPPPSLALLSISRV
ncbi:DUF6153 family protein [Cryobacterium sp. PAMC25264]|uniref:DUF6153 family protein n=1 Tax=Cryobacterium sp. PAMC25264 TaxID=2861288 RepID=UPI001C633DB8|nr:DUF6153 family protein [Cryobacterium sp. PAMC25264]QYF74444.1 hypothetical protein KY500_04375 [Cryobacterium sp. PAMC25264]